MTTITKERIELFIKNPLENGLTRGEQMELARIALASLEAEPVAYIFKHPAGKLFWALTDESNKEQPDVIPVYADSPAPVVPDEIDVNDVPRAVTYFKTHRDCYADGWISCSERMPKKNQNVLISVNFDSDLVEPLICSARYTGSTFRRGQATIKPGNGIEQATHWMPLPEPPQEAK